MSLRVAITFGDKSKREPYLAALLAAGMEPASIAPAEPRESLEGLCGLVLSGGADWGDQGDRDALEERLLVEALGRRLPVFGICRGLQVMNRVAGGTLHRHIDFHRNEVGSDHNVRHRVRTERGSLLCSIVGEELITNSRHHQAVDQVAPGYCLNAHAEDGVREGLELPGPGWVLGVQWHPEDMIQEPPHRRLFLSFAEAVAQAAKQAR